MFYSHGGIPHRPRYFGQQDIWEAHNLGVIQSNPIISPQQFISFCLVSHAYGINPDVSLSIACCRPVEISGLVFLRKDAVGQG